MINNHFFGFGTKKNFPSVKEYLKFLLIGMVFVPSAVFGGMGDAGGDSKWQFNVGAAYRIDTNIDANWNKDFVASQLVPFYRHHSSGNFSVPPLNGYANRQYEDGFVYIDPGTDDPETYRDGYTWYWGYEEPDQYTGDSVFFHSLPVHEFDISPVPISSWSENQRINQTGIDISIDRRLFSSKNLLFALASGLSWYPERDARFEARRVVARQSRNKWRYADKYSAPYDPFPDAPHSGTYEGPGYLLENIPDSRRMERLAASSCDWVAHSRTDLSMSVLDLRMGPSVGWMIHDQLTLKFTPQLRIAYVDSEMKEATSVQSPNGEELFFKNEFQDNNWIYGWGGELSADYYFSESWFAGVSVAADYWSEDVNIRGDAFDVDVELGEWSVTAGLGWEF